MIKLHTVIQSCFSFFRQTKRCIPEYIRMRLDAEYFSITQFMLFASQHVAASDRVLDAGAGACPYKRYFSHAIYESADCENSADTSPKGSHDFLCSLDKIPMPDHSYDAIVNTQVLEHVEYPERVIREFYRILKPGGKLFLTAPQGWGIHEAPNHFFHFTHYGLASLFTHAGFTILRIDPRGGIFWYLGQRISILPFYILSQYMYEQEKRKLKPLFFILLPLYIVSVPLCRFFIPLFFFYADRLDRQKDYTLGYACYCVKRT